MRNFLKKHASSPDGLFFDSQASIASVNVVPSGSMLPTLQLGEALVVNKHAYGWRVPLTSLYLPQSASPKRGDIVTFPPKGSRSYAVFTVGNTNLETIVQYIRNQEALEK